MPNLSERAPTTQLATFDDITAAPYPNNRIPIPYQGLNFGNFTIASVTEDKAVFGHAQFIPRSSPNYILSPDQFSQGPGVFSIQDTSTTSFDLLEFWVACFDTNYDVHYATACNLTIIGTEASATDPVETIEPLLFSYEPKSNSSAAPMAKVTTNLFGLSSVLVGFYETSSAVQLITAVGTDSFKYVTH
ncbi:hypothetical protein ABVK25_006451 [Lepraria finkii]|uniref:Uncharacterized protein n=1 Tax=Lepraria finkii TaxID=1340010 RepID=A0ABR4B5I0_9LECA